MDPLVPSAYHGGGAAAVALSASTATNRDALLEKLRTGEWTYPETKAGDVNLSVVFDIIFVVAFVLLWLYAVAVGGTPDVLSRPAKSVMSDEQRRAITAYCMKGNFNGNRNSGLFKYVNFFTMEEFTNWLSVSFISTIIALKIISGSANVNAGYIILVVIVGVIARHMRLGIKDQPKKQFPVVLFLLSMFLTLWAYTDAFDQREDDKMSVEHGQNWIYVFAGVLFLVAAGVKTAFSVSDMGKLGEVDTAIKAEALYNGEFAFYLTGLSTVVVGATVTMFVFCESMFVAYAATDFYAIPFYFLYVIPIYYFITVLYAGCGGSRSASVSGKATGFNVILVLVGLFVLVMAQGHVCSFPGPDGHHIEKNGCALKSIGFKSLAHDATELEMHRGWLATLGIFSIMFHVMLYAGARFSHKGIMRTIDEVCLKNEDSNSYSVL